MSFFTLTEICLPCNCLPFYRVPQGITLKHGGSPQLKSWHLETFWSRIEKAFRPLCLWCLSRYLSPYTYPLPIFLSGFISLPSLGVSLPMFVCSQDSVFLHLFLMCIFLYNLSTKLKWLMQMFCQDIFLALAAVVLNTGSWFGRDIEGVSWYVNRQIMVAVVVGS